MTGGQDHELPGQWRVKLTYKRRGIRGFRYKHWPPEGSALEPEGIDGYRVVWWLERTIRELAGQEGTVIRVELEPVSSPSAGGRRR